MNVKERLHNEILSLLIRLSKGSFSDTEDGFKVINNAFCLSWQDLQSYAVKDPTNRGSVEYVLDTCKSFRAVMAYRLAHEVEKIASTKNGDDALRLSTIARLISEDAKVLTSVEIHPKAKVGRNFIVDHGVGTVIGETCEIGDDCYILQSVLLGASNISSNKAGKRHPTIGNNVEIGSFSKILGPVRIGNNVFVGAGCLISSNIPDNSRVSVSSEYQIHRQVSEFGRHLKIYGFDILDDLTMVALGENFERENLVISIIDESYQRYEDAVEAICVSDRRLLIKVSNVSLIRSLAAKNSISKLKLELMGKTSQSSVIVRCFALDCLVRRIIQSSAERSYSFSQEYKHEAISSYSYSLP